MTSKNSFLVSIRENQKRRIWGWVISILAQFMLYPGFMIIYLSRINANYRDGDYTDVVYHKQLVGAAADAVGFQPFALLPVLFLGVVLAVQGFSYLYDRKKVDMYYSVPVSMKRRFFVVYVNGIFIYLLPALIWNLLAWIIAAAEGAFSLGGLAECAVAFVGNFIFFLVVYHTAMLAVMLTGHALITACAVTVLLTVEWWIVQVVNTLKDAFYEHADMFFSAGKMECKFCAVMEYLPVVNKLKHTAELGEAVRLASVTYAKWIALALIAFALAWFCYIKRPAESAGSAIAFRLIKPFVKVIISVIVGFLAYILTEEATYHNKPVAFLGLIVGTVLCCALMEVIYDFDIRSAFKHLVSSGTAAVIVLIIFCIYQFDIFGYDAYIPDADKVESVAVDIGPYQRYFEWTDESTESLYEADYLAENMFFTDVDAVCELARRSYEAEGRHIRRKEKWEDARAVSVLYRLKSGKEVSRYFYVEIGNPENEELLNRLIGSKEYKEGYYQIYQDNLPFETYRKRMKIYYNNGASESAVSASHAEELREALIKDMEQYDFSMARNNRVCGYIQMGMTGEYTAWTLPIYENFTNTIALLQEQNAYHPLELHAEDIRSLEIVNYHYDEIDDLKAEDILAIGSSSRYAGDYAVTAMIDDPQEIEQILPCIYPVELNDKTYWNPTTTDRNYRITITFNADEENILGRGYYEFYFIEGEVPEFVEKMTAYPPED